MEKNKTEQRIKLPDNCPNCFKEANYTNIIKKQPNDLNGLVVPAEYVTDAWFCKYCGGLVCFDKQ